jgi:hypothetical protein
MHLTLTLLCWIFRGIFELFIPISILYSSGICIVWISLHTHTVYTLYMYPFKNYLKTSTIDVLYEGQTHAVENYIADSRSVKPFL